MPDRFVKERETDRAYAKKQMQREIELEACGMSRASAAVVTKPPKRFCGCGLQSAEFRCPCEGRGA